MLNVLYAKCTVLLYAIPVVTIHVSLALEVAWRAQYAVCGRNRKLRYKFTLHWLLSVDVMYDDEFEVGRRLPAAY